jgi:hypothetical protein
MKFTYEDFLNHDMSPPSVSVSRYSLEKFQAERIAEIANTRLLEWLREAQIVFDCGSAYPKCYWTTEFEVDKKYAHKAKLICIEEIK